MAVSLILNSAELQYNFHPSATNIINFYFLFSIQQVLNGVVIFFHLNPHNIFFNIS